MNIILLGVQGSGKGTQATMLAKELKLCWISLGELLRKEAEKKTERGARTKKILAQGHLVPTELTIEILDEFITKNHCDTGYIFDGFPRTLDQAEALDALVTIDYVIELKLSDDDAIRRLSNRLQCKNGHIYGISIPSKKKGKCDIDGEKLFVREDDKPEAIKERLKIYHEETEPLLEYYEQRKIVHTIDSSKKPKEVFKKMIEVFNILN
ncbi:MAG: nucleoside monophosphate kinase [Candidatus Aenigmarchaeota archaeon]|nr:nucleoside monophosphate kinase [Candidatus Aenigmarchaeota archaeon]